MKFSKLYDGVVTPSRGTDGSAGMDLFVPHNTTEFKARFSAKNSASCLEENGIWVRPHERVLIPAGIKVNIPSKNYALIAANKSGVACKFGLVYGAHIIDSDYQGEVFISLINTTNDGVLIGYGQKIIQVLLIPVVVDEWEEVAEGELYACVSERGDGALGSTGN